MSTTKVSFYADRQAAVAAIADAQPKPRKGLESLAIRPDQVIEAAVEIGVERNLRGGHRLLLGRRVGVTAGRRSTAASAC